MTSAHDLILFDLDGTVSDPLVGIGRSLNYALLHFGYPEVELSEVSTHIGPPLDEAFRGITGVTRRDQLDAFVSKYRERYATIGYSENVLYDGVAEALATLHAAGIPLGVCTSKRRDFAERILGMFGLLSCFRFVSGGDIGIPKWKQVEGLLSEGLVSESTVMVGDRDVDMMAAHRNGVSAAGVLWGHGSREELDREQPRYVLGSPKELLTLAGLASKIL